MRGARDTGGFPAAVCGGWSSRLLRKGITMSELRERMIRDLKLAGLNDSTGAEGMPIQAAMGFIPLVVVALLELTKIPLVSSILYSESSFRKLVMMILLPCVCFLTFISLMTGLEQSTATREYNIEQSRVDRSFVILLLKSHQLRLHFALRLPRPCVLRGLFLGVVRRALGGT